MDWECCGCRRLGDWARCRSLPMGDCRNRLCPNCGVETGPAGDFKSLKVCSDSCVQRTWEFYTEQFDLKRPEPDALLLALKQHFGFTSFREPQREIIETILAKQSLLAVLPTGRGKSLCYQLPAVLSDGVTFVVSPLLALMQDQINALLAKGIPCAKISSDQTGEQNAQIYAILRTMPRKLKLVFVAPETFVGPIIRELLEMIAEHISLFAIDEAHCISTWGADFRPHYQQLSFLTEEFPEIPILALTATATKKIKNDIFVKLGLPVGSRVVTASFNRPEIHYSVEHKAPNPMAQVAKIIQRYPEGTALIVYCWRRVDCEELAKYLSETHKIHALPYHAGLGNVLRQDTLFRWKSGEVSVICATIAFGMGIDNQSVRAVIHSTMPTSVENFFQESGRAGRDGQTAHSIVLYTKASVKALFSVFSKPKDPTNPVEVELAEHRVKLLKQMQAYCETRACRREFLLKHFDDPNASNLCNKTCDNCRKNTLDKYVIARQ